MTDQQNRKVERRVVRLFDVVLREAGEGTGGNYMTASGYASVFDVASLPLFDWWYGEYVERIAPGAFTSALARSSNVHLVYSHDMASAMASTESETLQIFQDELGLRYVAQLDPADMDVQRVAPKMQRGIVKEMSFAFTVATEGDNWLVEDLADGTQRVTRTILEIDELFELSIVPQGAYPQTEAGLRELRSKIRHAATDGLIPGFQKREGKTLSASSKQTIQAAVDQLQELLDAAEGERGRMARARFKELRADIESLEALVCMYEWGVWFIGLENQPDDADDRANMQSILDTLDGLIKVEAAEPYDPADEAAEGDEPDEEEARSRRAGAHPAGGEEPVASGVQPAGEVAREREAEAMRMQVALAEHLAIQARKVTPDGEAD